MVEVEISSWKMLDGTWQVTVKKSRKNSNYLSDCDSLFRDSLTEKEALDYGNCVFNRYAVKGNIIFLSHPNIFGEQVVGGWVAFRGKRVVKKWIGGKELRKK